MTDQRYVVRVRLGGNALLLAILAIMFTVCATTAAGADMGGNDLPVVPRVISGVLAAGVAWLVWRVMLGWLNTYGGHCELVIREHDVVFPGPVTKPNAVVVRYSEIRRCFLVRGGTERKLAVWYTGGRVSIAQSHLEPGKYDEVVDLLLERARDARFNRAAARRVRRERPMRAAPLHEPPRIDADPFRAPPASVFAEKLVRHVAKPADAPVVDDPNAPAPKVLK